MKLKNIFILLILFAGLALYIWRYEMPQQAAERIKDNVFKKVSAEEISSITVVHDNETLELVNSNPHPPTPIPAEDKVEDSSDEITGKKEEPISWHLKDLPHALLDPGRVNSLVSSVASLATESTIESSELEADKAIYGITNPELSVTVSAKGTTKKLIFGKVNSYVGKRYLSIDGDPALYLVSNSLFEAANKSKDEFRDKTPITFTDNSVRGIGVTSPSQDIELVHGENQDWKMTKPFTATGSSFAVYDLFRNLRNLQAESFVDDPKVAKAQFGLDAPQRTITVKRPDGDIVVRFGKKDNKRYFQVNNEGTVYGTPLDYEQTFTEDVTAYREKQLFRFDNFFTQKVVIEPRGKEKLELTKDGESWKLNGKNADAPFVRQYLKDLSDTKVSAFPTGSEPLGFDKPQLTVTVFQRESEKDSSKKLLIGATVGDYVAVMIDGSNELFFIDQTTFNSINVREEKLLPAPPVTETPKAK